MCSRQDVGGPRCVGGNSAGVKCTMCARSSVQSVVCRVQSAVLLCTVKYRVVCTVWL